MFDIAEFRQQHLPSENDILSRFSDCYSTPVVSFVCTTFNHELFIEDTIRGFLLQDTKFSFEILIHDDCSTDGTANIIRKYADKYPKLIKAYYQEENQYSKNRHFPLHYMFSEAKGKFIAICEGDDFWIDTKKIDNQVGQLISNSNAGLIYSKAFVNVLSDGNNCRTSTGRRTTKSALYLSNTIPTLTVMFKKNLLVGFNERVQSVESEWLQSDYPLWLWLSERHDIIFDDYESSVYRVLKSSASRPDSIESQYRFRISAISIVEFFSSVQLSEKEHSNVMSRNHLFCAIWCALRKLPYYKYHADQAQDFCTGFRKLVLKTLFSRLSIKILFPLLALVKGYK